MMISGGKFAQSVFEKGSGNLKIGNNFLNSLFKKENHTQTSKYVLLWFFSTKIKHAFVEENLQILTIHSDGFW